jgi:protein-tyrosine phosphatase
VTTRRSGRKATVLTGAVNFRDLGGLRIEGGGHTRPGRLFRSNGLEELTAEDVDYLVEVIGLRTVIDLRTSDDADLHGPLTASPVEHLNLPFVQASPALGTARPLTADGRADVPLVLRQFMEMSTPSIRTMFEALAGGAMPAVIHCAAGKDRTGVAVALVLCSIGATRSAVIDDYAASGDALPAVMEYLLRRPTYADVVPQLPAGTMDADPTYMRDFLDDVDSRYGGVRRWLVEHTGVPVHHLDAIRRELVAVADSPESWDH